MNISVVSSVLFSLVFISGADGGSVFENTGVSKLEQRSKHIYIKIRRSKSEIERIKKKESLALNSLNEQDIAIDNIRKNISSLKDELKTVNLQIAGLGEEIKALDKEIETSEVYLSKRLVALYKLNQVGRMHIFASMDSMYEIIQHKAYLERILGSDKKEINALFENRNRLNNLHAGLNEKKAKQKLGEKFLEEQIKKLSSERYNRTKLLDAIRSKKALEIAAVKSLEEAAQQLDNAINILTTERGGINYLQKDFVKSPESFKGLLNLPVKGKIAASFGAYHDPKYNVVNFRSGIDIEAERGEPIRSVIAGNIIYSGWFKGYGNMIIIDHGKSYYTVYAHLEERFKSKGDVVEADEVIASAGDTGSFSGTGLYFEVRHHGKPLDPLEWFKK